VLLDEIEKAHPDVFNVLLAGARRRASTGRPRPHGGLPEHRVGDDFEPRLGGNPDLTESGRLRRDQADGARRRSPSISVRSFLNRIDDVVVFHPLGREHMTAIAEIQLGLCALD
jgi:ATP-dependent Clp protease ATP-binding subunit ClpB